MARTFGQSAEDKPREIPEAKSLPAEPQNAPITPVSATPAIPRLRPSRFGTVVLVAATLMGLFWIGVGAAFLWGYLGPGGLIALDPARKALVAAAVLMPPFLFLAMAAALARSAAMSDATRVLLAASDRLFAADETAAANAARLARVVRRELDGLNTGLDVAFQRMRNARARTTAGRQHGHWLAAIRQCRNQFGPIDGNHDARHRGHAGKCQQHPLQHACSTDADHCLVRNTGVLRQRITSGPGAGEDKCRQALLRHHVSCFSNTR